MTGHPHSCPRCGSPVAGTGKTGMCKPCATSLAARRTGLWPKIRNQSRPVGYGTPRRAPITLPILSKSGEAQ